MTMVNRPFAGLTLLVSWLFLLTPLGLAAETADPIQRSTTRIAIALDTADRVPVRTSFESFPPTVEIRFPRRRVTASLPERVAVAGGAVQAIEARYDAAGRGETARFIQSLRVVLTGPFVYRVESEPGRVVIEIDHPASVRGASMEVGMGSGTVVRSAPVGTVSERFRAMQEALARARPAAITMQWDGSNGDSAVQRGTGARVLAPSPAASSQMKDARGTVAPPARASSGSGAFPVFGVALLVGLTLAGAAGSWRLIQRQAAAARAAAEGRNVRLPSGVLLIDQLVWKAFERQGYQLLMETELTQPPLGTLRILAKDELKTALLFVGSGRFFEKQTVERFIRAMREAHVEQGWLAASGSFTVPAQRVAKEHRITLIGRDQLVELLSMGAGSEYFSRQLEQSHAHLEEAKDTLRQYAAELDTLRRQRNEASWHLGEERAKSATLEAALEALGRQVSGYEAQIQRWEQEAVTLRKQWEESQWFLGEARERSRYLDTQVASLQALAKQVEAVERERSDAVQSLGEERAKHASLAGRLDELQRELEQAMQRSGELEASLARVQDELAVYRTLGERRRAGRIRTPKASVELVSGGKTPAAAAWLCDLSATGLGLETDRELPQRTPIRVRVRVPGREPLETGARFVWQRPHGSDGRHRSGCRFIRPPAETRAALQELVSQGEAPRA